MNIILIYEFFPDSTQVYNLPDLEQRDGELILQCHGIIGGTSVVDQDHPVNNFLPDFIEQYKDRIVFDTKRSNNKPFHIDMRAVLVLSGYMV